MDTRGGTYGGEKSAEYEKAQAQQQAAGDCCNDVPKTTTGYTGAQRPMSAAEGRIRDLSERAYRAQRDSAKLSRVLEILERHPEFHEFLEVLQSGLV